MILVIDVLQLNRKFTLFCMLCDNIIGACKYFSVTQHHIKPCQLKVLQGDLTVCPGLSSKGCTFLQYSAVVHSSYLSIRAAVAQPGALDMWAPAQFSVASLMYPYAQDPVKLVIQQASSLAFIPCTQMIQGLLAQATARSGLSSCRGWPSQFPVSSPLNGQPLTPQQVLRLSNSLWKVLPTNPQGRFLASPTSTPQWLFCHSVSHPKLLLDLSLDLSPGETRALPQTQCVILGKELLFLSATPIFLTILFNSHN